MPPSTSTPKPQAVAIIPARLGSTRLPRKPLADVGGKPLIQWVVEKAQRAKKLAQVVVATDSQEIADVVSGFGGVAHLTRGDHATGSDRIGEILPLFNHDIIVNLQGDEPEMSPALIDRLIDVLDRRQEWGAVTAACPFPDSEDSSNPNAVKVVCDLQGAALYFSRAQIPSCPAGSSSAPPSLLHLGIYAYRRATLERFLNAPRGILESYESLEQLRLLENGERLGVVLTDRAPAGIDTPEDLAGLRGRLKTEYDSAGSGSPTPSDPTEGN